MSKGNIATRQNEKLNIERLSAADQLYTSAKRWKTFQVSLSVVVLVLFSFLKSYLEKSDGNMICNWNWEKISPFISLVSVIIAFLNLYLFKYLLTQKVKLATFLQYESDCFVLGIEKNAFLNKETLYEDIKKYSDRCAKRKPLEEFIDWYPSSIANAEKNVGKFICLRSNYVWDISLRKYHRTGIIIIFSIIIGLILFISIIKGISFSDFVIETILPLLPLITLCLTEIIENNKTISKKEAGLGIITDIWHKYIEKNINETDLNKFFKECLESLHILRSENPLIANWENKIVKKWSEKHMIYGADGLIKEYEDSLK